MMNQFVTKRSNFLQCIHRQQVKQLGHPTRSTTIYQKEYGREKANEMRVYLEAKTKSNNETKQSMISSYSIG